MSPDIRQTTDFYTSARAMISFAVLYKLEPTYNIQYTSRESDIGVKVKQKPGHQGTNPLRITSNISVILMISLKEAPLVHSWTTSIMKGLNLSTYSSSSSSIFASLETLNNNKYCFLCLLMSLYVSLGLLMSLYVSLGLLMSLYVS